MENEIYWQAVTTNDPRFDGAFVLGVKTTGIYCRPSCRARLPKRENTEFYDSPKTAEERGFRACKRCLPNKTAGVQPQVAKVLKACEVLDRGEPVSLTELAGIVGLSSYHLQRSFKDIIGVSPRKYAEAKRMERFRQEVREGGEITDAIYEAGFGSSSRVYEKAAASLGMSPGVYKKGARGVGIVYTITDCELGKMLVARTNRGICSITFGDDAKELADALANEFPRAEISPDSGELKTAVDAILAYLSGRDQRLVLPLDLKATSFQLQVWEQLRKIPYGETRSYGQIAEELGDRKKVRAVARACATNPVALVTPCHRVIAADGGLSGYRWGIERKRRLLAAEKAAVAPRSSSD